MLVADLDFETYSEAGIDWNEGTQKWVPVRPRAKKGIQLVGAYKYAEHPSTEILCIYYDIHDGKGTRGWVPGMPPPQDLIDYALNGGLIEAHNSFFEWCIWNLVGTRQLGFPPLPIEQTRCSASKARRWSIPGALGKAADVCGGPPKNEDGKRVMLKVSQPRNPTKKNPAKRWTPENSPEDFTKTYLYCYDDVEAQKGVSAACPPLTEEELEIWMTDQKINARGVQIDLDMVYACISIVDQATHKYNAELQQLAGCKGSEVAQLQTWVNAQLQIYSPTTPKMLDMTADSLRDYLAMDLPAHIHRAIEIREMISSASVKKLFAMIDKACADGRARDVFMYCGADRTGRWSSLGIQLQNMTTKGPEIVECGNCKTVHKKGILCPSCLHEGGKEIDWGIEGMEAAFLAIKTRNLGVIEALWGNPFLVIAGCIRGMLTAGPDKDLICSDYSAIEAVVLACLAGEQWRIDVFNDHGKIYEMSAAKISGIGFDEIMAYKEAHGTHHPLRKKVGKVAELASGYGGWIGAWKNFGADAFMNDDEIKQNILKWRDASPMIVEFWGGQWRKDPDRWHFEPELYGVEGAAVSAILTPNAAYAYRDITYQYDTNTDVLYCRLPSGRLLSYHQPRLERGTAPHGNPEWKITYMGYNTDATKGPIGWVRLSTYGGKLTENIVQAVARDILAYALVNAEKAHYYPVLHVHDEPVAEVPKGWGTVEEFEAIMNRMPPWAEGWPIKATGGWRGLRFRKD